MWSNACACVHASVVCVFTCVQCVCMGMCACVCVCVFKILNSSVLNTCMAIVCVAGSLKLNCMFY